MKTILCYGDSNTWGADPVSGGRHKYEDRWTTVLQNELGKNYNIIPEGLCGRTTVHTDPFEDYKSGKEYLIPCLETHEPDIFILMLGTNDLKIRFDLTPFDIAKGVDKLIKIIKSNRFVNQVKMPVILLISPPEIYEVDYFGEMFAKGAAKSTELATYYKTVAEEHSCHFLAAADYIKPSKTEGIHWEASQHHILGKEIAKLIKKL